jgi:hypothetical protein
MVDNTRENEGWTLEQRAIAWIGGAVLVLLLLGVIFDRVGTFLLGLLGSVLGASAVTAIAYFFMLHRK